MGPVVSQHPRPTNLTLWPSLLEIGNLAPALLVADRCVKAAGVTIIGIESTDGAAQCIKLSGRPAAVREAAETRGGGWDGRWARRSIWTVHGRPVGRNACHWPAKPPVYSPLLGVYDVSGSSGESDEFHLTPSACWKPKDWWPRCTPPTTC